MERPIIAITMGDAAGIGPELICRVLADPGTHSICRPLVVGDVEVMRRAVAVAGATLNIRPVQWTGDADYTAGVLNVFQPKGLTLDDVRPGLLTPACGEASARCLKTAFELAVAEFVQGVVSAPLNKEAFHAAGYHYADELAYAADLTDSEATYILGVARGVWTIAVSEHVRFREIADRATKGRILWCIHEMAGALESVGVAEPCVAVAALNVHAGEGGLFGDEEILEISPAIAQAQAEGIDAQGPVPADAVFPLAFAGRFDGIVCMYHDQANIARKLQPMSEGATIFMGLPVPCGTTAHGTAFDIAGRGIADPGSLAAALRYTSRMALERQP